MAQTILDKRKNTEARYCNEMFRLKNENIILSRDIEQLKHENEIMQNNIYYRITNKISKILKG